MVINGTTISDGMSYYINGMKVNPQHNGESQVDNAPGTGILYNRRTLSPVWIDELCFWNRTLDDQEIEDLFDNYGNNI